jgi:hypothetical protein
VSACGRAFFAGSLIVLGTAAATLLVAHDSGPGASARSAALRLSLLRAASGDPDRQSAPQRASGAGTRTVVRFPRGTVATAVVAKPPNGITFGQPAIAGVAGWGFEPDLRGDPTDPNRIYVSSPDSGGSDTSWIWRSLDGGKTFKWIPAARR